MTIHVARAGLRTTVQDEGRRRHQHEGVPECGAMDPLALRIANLLVGNEPGAAALELTLIGPSLYFAESTLIAVTGATMQMSADGESLPGWRPILLPAGAALDVGRATLGARAYLAVAGGIAVPTVLGSRSTYERATLGGFHGRALRTGDELPVGESSALSLRITQSIEGVRQAGSAGIARWSSAPEIHPVYSNEPVVRITTGAHSELLTEASCNALFEETFRVSSRSDRMGYRLDGPTLALSQPLELHSEAVAFGTLQLPPGGTPIILMADRQTTGGYPRIGEVATVDIPLVAQLGPGAALRFRTISLEEAQRVYVERERELALFAQGIRLRHG